MADVTITLAPNGPYLVDGPLRVVDAEGRPLDTGGKPRIALCRCGGSARKPFCDGTHGRIGFRAEDAVPPSS